MTRFAIFTASILALAIFPFLIPLPVCAQDISDDEITTSDNYDEFEMTDEELAALLQRVDRFYINQGMASLTVDIDILRDPSNRLNDRNIRENNPSQIAGLSRIISHFAYRYPEFYSLSVMGETLAGSDVPDDQTFFSVLLPVPGAPIFTESILERFVIWFDKIDEVEGTPAYKIRLTAIDPDSEFFNYLVYYIDMENEVVLRVESYFDNGWYKGMGEGNFYYDYWLGKFLPIYGHGNVLFFPNQRFNIWGRWYQWNWTGEEELEPSSVSGEPPVEEAVEESPEPQPETDES